MYIYIINVYVFTYISVKYMYCMHIICLDDITYISLVYINNMKLFNSHTKCLTIDFQTSFQIYLMCAFSCSKYYISLVVKKIT